MAAEGTLLELASRGKKDAFFIQNPRRTWFGADYERRSATARDLLRQNTENPPLFDTWVDVEIPRTADVLENFEIRIDMPTWLPPEVVALNYSHVITIENTNVLNPVTGLPTRARYGWSNGIADNVIQQWELYADNIKLCEGYGLVHSVYNYSNTTHAKAPILHASSGYHDGSAKAIQRNATPPQLTCRLPLPGCQWEGGQGLPICALLNQRLRVRLYIAAKSQLVESTILYTDASSGLPIYDVCPAPWGDRRIFIDGAPSEYRTLAEWQVGQLDLYAQCTVLHLENEIRTELMAKPIVLPFHKLVYDLINFNEKSWQVGSHVNTVIETRGFFDALYIRFFAEARARQNKYRDTLAPGGREWISQLSLITNGVERISSWDPKKLRILANNTQLPRDINDPLYYLIFGQPIDHEPAGTLFLSRTHKSQLSFTIANLPVDPAVKSKFVYVYLLGIAWNIMDIYDGKAHIRFLD